MHRDVVTQVVVSKTDFIISGCAGGNVKFWKKSEEGIEFVKVNYFAFTFKRLLHMLNFSTFGVILEV